MSLIKIENKLLNDKMRFKTQNIIKIFRNTLAKQGKRHVATKIISHVFFFIKSRKNISCLNFIYQAICNVRPLIGIKNNGRSNSNKNNIQPLSLEKSYQLAIRWLIQGAKQRKETSIALCLFYELIDAYDNKGFAIKKKYEWHVRPLSTQLKTKKKKK